MGRPALVKFTRVTVAAFLVLAMGAAGVWGSDTEFAYGESVSGQEGSCGAGEWIAGEERAFGHEIDFSIRTSSEDGFVVDCYSGTDAFLEYRGRYYGGVYVYVVWGQLGAYA